MSENKTGNARPSWTRRDAILMSAETILFIVQVVLCFLFYNWAGLNLLLYLGWIVLVIAMVLGWRARVAFETRGQATEKESWLRTTTVVDNDIYGIVRHPMYLAFMLIFIGIFSKSRGKTFVHIARTAICGGRPASMPNMCG